MKALKYLLLLVLLLALLVPISVAMAKGPGGGGGGPPDNPGGGGHTEPAGNNLSVPVIWPEGSGLSLPGTILQASLTVPYDFNDDGIVDALDMGACGGTAYAYAQKTEGNVWQAENASTTGLFYVSEIDWGDSLESVDMKVGRPVRVELSLYKTGLSPTMTGYTMVMLANPSSPDEVQGVCAPGDPLSDNGTSIVSYASSEATVYSPFAKLIIQKVGDTATLLWDGTQWTGDASAPLTPSFAGELNVGGKVIYGLSQGGWRPTDSGVYRITFYLPLDKNTLFDASTTIRASGEVEAEAGGGAVVVPESNLTYIDVTVVGGGGGGGGGGKPQ